MVFFLLILSLLIIAHFVADFALQNEFVAKFKARSSGVTWWPWVLSSHSFAHGGIVALAAVIGTSFGLSECAVLGLILAETGAHALTDFAKTEGWFGAGDRAFHIDQTIHIVTKIAWAAVIVGVAA
ncbi:DUF3307 domain-containing protein [Magnetospirillum molischianum]|uniref:DUF3307 domain-containing protein n=1 Tax=Magnetospirillum molischianum DSM 120 TaxID=1150626 RepID=H8FY40_MAGML|nr:DUF3307 domain-containing protein [Magnetospirillum molischianum]CCG43278.1 conserved exported hypothetical protein [Magnetospirillum molischianum DSM 120]